MAEKKKKEKKKEKKKKSDTSSFQPSLGFEPRTSGLQDRRINRFAMTAATGCTHMQKLVTSTSVLLNLRGTIFRGKNGTCVAR